MWLWRSLEKLRQDIHYALRMLRKNPGFSIVAVLSLALGIGANTTIFSLLNAVLLRPLPVESPDRLVALMVSKPDRRPDSSFSYPLYKELRDKNTVFSDVFAHNMVPVTITIGTGSERAISEMVSGNFFTALGVKPAYGRLLDASDDVQQDGHPVAVINYQFWQNRFSGSPDAVGQVIRLNGFPFTIVGIAPRGFFGVEVGASPDLWVPIMMQAQVMIGGPPGNMLERRTAYWLPVMARLKPGVSEQEAQAGADLLYQQLLQEDVQKLPADHPMRGFLAGRQVELQPVSRGLSRLRAQFSWPLLVLMGMVALVLLAACVNLANLLLARSASRRKEIAIRLAVGASRFRLIQQLVTESLLLALMGGALGLAFAYYAGDIALAFLPKSTVPMALQLRIDMSVLIFTLVVSILTGILFGLTPALQTTRTDLNSALKSGKVMVQGRRRFELTSGLIIGQVVLSLVLLADSALLVRSLQNLRSTDSGFDSAQVLTASLDTKLGNYDDQRARTFYTDLLARLGSLPGVKAASLADGGPLSRARTVVGVSIEGSPAPPGQQPDAVVTHIAPGFFDTLGMRLLAGRDITDNDREASLKMAVVNESFAQRFFSDGNTIGKHIGLGGEGSPLDTQIVGVVRSAKDILRDEAEPTIYLPFTQGSEGSGPRILYVRAGQDPSTLFESVRRVVSNLDQNLPVLSMKTLTQQVDDSLVQERMMATLASFFGLMALVLAAVGLYGVTSYRVAQRRREFGIRLALGAQRGQLQWLILRNTLVLVLCGIVVGLPAAIITTRLVKSFLFGLTTTDPLTFAIVMMILVITAILAAYLPARRASRVDPIIVLRDE